MGKTRAREQSASVAENGRHDHGLQNGILVWYNCPIATGKVERDKQQDKGNEESGLWF